MSESQHRDDRRSDLAVLDANEYKQKRRLERILDTLDGVEQKANSAWNRYAAGEIDQQAKNIIIQRAVKEAIREVYNLLRVYSRTADHDPYWRGRMNGSEDAWPVGEFELPNGDGVAVDGLQDFLQTQEMYQTRWVEIVKERHMPAQKRSHEQTKTVPEWVSFNAYLKLCEFLDEVHDLEIAFEEMDKDKLPMIRDFDQSGDEPTSEAGEVQFRGDPDL